jgi:hypothetical protein
MRRAIMIAGLILAVGVLAPVGALGKAGGTDRPIKGDASGTTVVDLGTPPLSFTADATGSVAHLGRSTFDLDGVLTPTGPDTFTIAGTVVLVAANDDELFGTFTGSGTNDASGSHGTVTTTFTGGTGRFENATGSVTGPFTQVFISTDGTTSTFATDTSFRGAISY